MALEKTPLCNFGEKAKDFNLKSIDENKYSFKDIVGDNGTLIMFICNHCPYVKAISKEISKTAVELKKYKINVAAIMSNDFLLIIILLHSLSISLLLFLLEFLL